MSKKDAFPKDWNKELIERTKSITAKRAKTVIYHIMKHGQITSDELQNKYGYRHTSRAIRDVRELGIPIESFRVTSSDGRKISAYRFASIKNIHFGMLAGRKVFPKSFKEDVVRSAGLRCNICLQHYEERYLQIDHRIPYEIIGETNSLDIKEFMPLCASCNRAKSWSCEHCSNWIKKNSDVCKMCYWSKPEDYQHIATEDIRRLAVVWKGNSISEYDKLITVAKRKNVPIQEYIKHVLARHLNR